MTLTEQWKKGELEWGKNYYCRNVKTNETNICFLYGSTWYSADSDGEGDIDWQGSLEVLAPVPSYEEWKQLHKFLEEFNTLEVANENDKLKTENKWYSEQLNEAVKEVSQLKELLLQIRNRQSLIREYLSDCKLGNAWDLLYQTENEIDNAIGEKK